MSASSTIILEVIEAMRKCGLASLAFYYYDFREGEKKDRRGLLSSVLFQLSDQSAAPPASTPSCVCPSAPPASPPVRPSRAHMPSCLVRELQSGVGVASTRPSDPVIPRSIVVFSGPFRHSQVTVSHYNTVCVPQRRSAAIAACRHHFSHLSWFRLPICTLFIGFYKNCVWAALMTLCVVPSLQLSVLLSGMT